MIKINNILCPTDLTPESDEALRYAVALAQKYDALLFVMHCIETPKSPVAEAIEDATDSIVATVEKWTRLGQPVKIRWEPVVLLGNPIEEINRVAIENKADLIVIRSLQGPLAARLFGSVSEAICHSSPCPVLVTHPGEHEWAGRFTRDIDLKRILVAFDFSPDAELALSYGLSLAQEYQTELHLISVRSHEPKSTARKFSAVTPDYDNPYSNIEQQLKEAIPVEALLWCQLRYAVLDGEPCQKIVSYAKQNEIDLICMGVKGSGPRIHNPLGSNIDHALHRSPCPVIVVRPAGAIAGSFQSNLELAL